MDYFRKKLLYTIRKFGMISNGDVVGYKEGSDFRSVVLKEMLEMFSKRANISLVKLLSKKARKIAVNSTLDLEANEITETIIKNSAESLKKASPVENSIVKPLYLFLDEEVFLYAKLRNLKFKDDKRKQNKISEFIDVLEKKHPEIKRAIVNSYLKIYNREK